MSTYTWHLVDRSLVDDQPCLIHLHMPSLWQLVAVSSPPQLPSVRGGGGAGSARSNSSGGSGPPGGRGRASARQVGPRAFRGLSLAFSLAFLGPLTTFA